MPPGALRSLRYRLGLLFALIVTGAIGVVYVYVVPPLESSLRQQKLRALVQATAQTLPPVARAIGREEDFDVLARRVRQAADVASARATLLGIAPGTQAQPYVASDSGEDPAVLDDFTQVVDDAVRSRSVAVGTEATINGRVGQAARPIVAGGTVTHVLVLSDSLADVQAAVGLIRRQILIAGTIALVVAALAGFLVSRALALRVRRLEQAARRVAAGEFSQPIEIGADDEIGRLAAAFDDMQRQLAELDSARKRFIATASHELRTPIFSLGGFLELLEDEELDAETRRAFIGQVRGQVERLTRLATELLDLSRLEAGSLDLRPESTDVADLVRVVAGEFTPAAARTGTRLELDLPDAGLPVTCDPDRVAQVLRILLDNAIVHTPAGTPVAVAARRADGHVELAVHDAGLGIHRTALPRLFEPFFSAGDSQGAGLGLAIAHELATRMDGDLLVHSRPGTTTFTFRLPAQP